MTKTGEHEYILGKPIDITASGQALAWDVGLGELFTSTAAHALKETFEHVLEEENRSTAQRIASAAPQYPRWLMIRNDSATGNTIEFQQTAIAAQTGARVVYRNGQWLFDADQQPNPVPAPVAAVKRCTCGVQFTGGMHSDWCDLHV